ncbi:Protein of unknown function, DUF393 [Seminavis robusta]|uniref:DUF393 domain-containing protein n=1 Tax=Seminavis robusta TaxID=568900 RepID=A0A9N8H7J0_9STRA|nr:Protein of unknown function, DUF393 [Seminavis robusta]|eukprot:Sro181_g079030.1 Protein of unknown function, DUF393 (237) ;mRNA; f:29070-29780
MIGMISTATGRGLQLQPTSAFLATSCTSVRRGPVAPNSLGRHPLFSALFSTKSRPTKRLFPEELNIIYDSKCNVCKLEIEFLRRRDARLSSGGQQQSKLRFTDLEDERYDSTDPANGGISYERGMASMHAVKNDGTVVNGVPVFEMAYRQVNLGWLFAVTKIWWVKRVADWAYGIFAKYRTRITRGKSLETLVESYREKKVLEAAQQQQLKDCEPCKTVGVTKGKTKRKTKTKRSS